MANIGFEENVQGLQNYYLALDLIDPESPSAIEAAKTDMYFSDGKQQVASQIKKAKEIVAADIGHLGRSRYFNLGFDRRPINSGPEEIIQERADILAVVTGALTQEIRANRAQKIAKLLSAITSGQEMVLTAYDVVKAEYKQPKHIEIEPGRLIYGVFHSDRISSRRLTFQYDNPSAHLPTQQPAEKILDVELPELFYENALLLGPAEN
jgi:hypothetical protein